MEKQLNIALVLLVVALCGGCTCAEETAPARVPAPVTKKQPAARPDEAKPDNHERHILARVEQFCTQWNTASWMLFGARNPFHNRIMSKVRRRGEEPPAQICRKIKLKKVIRGARAVAVGFSAEFRDPRLPDQWVPKPDYCFVMDTRSEFHIVYWNDKTAEQCRSSQGYFQRLDSFKGDKRLCEIIYRPQQEWLLGGGGARAETCLGSSR